MWNRSRIRVWTTLLPCLTTLCVAFLLYHLTSTVAGGSPFSYTPVDNILLNCGSSGNSIASDGRTWIGDKGSRFFLPEQSIIANATQQSASGDKVPYAIARIFVSPFTYKFPVTAGQKFIRLYFHPASYLNFDRSNSLFSVKAGGFTLLNNFNASLTADVDGGSGDTIFREYCVNIEEHQMLNITFTPSDVPNAYAFINGIEILSMPSNLYYTPSGYEGPFFIGQENLYRIDNSTALEMVYRVNVGGRSISPSNDTGMFRGWSSDDDYLTQYKQFVLPFNSTIDLKFTKVPSYIAPDEVYQTARTLGTNKNLNNLTWEFPVYSGFDYLVRLHFCEFQPEITRQQERVFHIFIANLTAEKEADVFSWSGGNGVPVYRDYAVSMIGIEGKKKMNLSIALEANQQNSKTSSNDVILNGVEIFKVSAFNGSLAQPNPDPLPLAPQTVGPPARLTKSKNNRTTIVAVVGGGVSGLVVLFILAFLIFRRRKIVRDCSLSDGTTWWGLFSFSTNMPTKTRMSSLPSNQCRRFSLAKIKAATNNFNESLIIGVGGFGNVYKGCIDNDVNPVAIKRLTPGSQQGAHEFETEIEMLSLLRHRHLVSLIGYCNDGNEMILVYDFMARGTLRDHLHKTTDNPPIHWKQRLEICIGAARGLNYLHTGMNHAIIHRDVKTTNILLDEKWVAKVSDFGLSKIGKSETHVSTNVKGTFGYLDPEYYRRQQLSQKSDVYSFGVVLFEVLSAKPPIIRTGEMQVVCLAEWAPKCYRNGDLDQIVDPSLKDEITTECLKTFAEIAVNCLHDNGINRPSMNDVVRDLEQALRLQESADKDARLEEEIVQPNDMCSSSRIDGQDFSEIVNLQGR